MAEQLKEITAYVASGYGFAESTRLFMTQTFIPRLKLAGVQTINPWDLTSEDEVFQARSGLTYPQRVKSLGKLNFVIGSRNRQAIEKVIL